MGRIDAERKTADSLNYVYVIGHRQASSELPIINEGVNNKYTQLVLDYNSDDPADRTAFTSAATVIISPARECRSYSSDDGMLN